MTMHLRFDLTDHDQFPPGLPAISAHTTDDDLIVWMLDRAHVRSPRLCDVLAATGIAAMLALDRNGPLDARSASIAFIGDADGFDGDVFPYAIDRNTITIHYPDTWMTCDLAAAMSRIATASLRSYISRPRPDTTAGLSGTVAGALTVFYPLLLTWPC